MNTYEIMFLFDSSFGSDFSAVETEIDRLMQRAAATVILTKRLEERKLAFEIKGQKRGVYVVTYFQSPGESITSLERDCRLSDPILRVMILRADELSQEQMERVSFGTAVAQHVGTTDSEPGMSPKASDRPQDPQPQEAAVAEGPAGIDSAPDV